LPIQRIPVTADNTTVLGHRVKATSPMWAGLDFDGAEPRQQNSAILAIAGPHEGLDVHLSVPFLHPEDKARGMKHDGCMYRVRPRAQVGKKFGGRKVTAVAFEKWNGRWCIAITTQ
jgi:hypothetical protein